MGDKLPKIYLARHGETAWTITGQHAGRVDLPLTDHGECEARKLAGRLQGGTYAKVFTSPLQRARRTCVLVGFEGVAEIDPDLVEWDYGRYEGLLRSEILKDNPGWHLFQDGCPGGETPEQVTARADRVVKRVRAIAGDVLLFSSRDLIKVLPTRWIGMDAVHGESSLLNTASLSMLGYQNRLEQSAIQLWNDTCHLRAANVPGDHHANAV